MSDDDIDTLLNKRPVAETNETLESSPGHTDTYVSIDSLLSSCLTSKFHHVS